MISKLLFRLTRNTGFEVSKGKLGECWLSIKECGDNALEVIYGLKSGMVFSEYPIIPFDFDKVTVSAGGVNREIADYTELKEWWENGQ